MSRRVATPLEQRFERVKNAFSENKVPWNISNTFVFLRSTRKQHALVLEHSFRIALGERDYARHGQKTKGPEPIGNRVDALLKGLGKIQGVKVEVSKTPANGRTVHHVSVTHEGSPVELEKLDVLAHVPTIRAHRNLAEIIAREKRILAGEEKGGKRGERIQIGEIPHQ